MADEKLVFQLRAEHEKLAADYKKAVNHTKRMSKSMNNVSRQIQSTLAGAFAVGGMVAFGKSVIDTTAKFQKMEAVLTNTLGSGSEAQKAMQMISDFASKTPFQVDGLTGSFVKLANQGFVPTANEMRKLGDLASSTGKDFDQLAEAVIDAQVGEFERLKEFGIRASKQGDQVKFTFKGVQQQVQFTDQAIRDYVLSLGDANGVSGSMAAISETVGGKISNLNDKFTQLKNTLGNQSSGVIAGILDFSNTLLEGINRLAEGELLDDDPFKLGQRIGKNLQIANEDIATEVDKMSSKLQEMRSKVVEISDFLNNNDVSVTRAVKLKEVQEGLFGQIQKYVGILSVLNPKLDDYNKSTEEAAKKTKDLEKAFEDLQATRRGRQLSDINSAGANLGISPISAPFALGRQNELFEKQKQAIQKQYADLTAFIIEQNNMIADITASTLNAAFDTIIDGIATGNLQNAFTTLKAVFGQGLVDAGKALIGWGKVMNAIKAALAKGILGGPAALIGGGLAIAAGTALKAAAASSASRISSGLGGGGGGGASGSFGSNITGQNFSLTPKPIEIKFQNGSLTGMLEFENQRNVRTR